MVCVRHANWLSWYDCLSLPGLEIRVQGWSVWPPNISKILWHGIRVQTSRPVQLWTDHQRHWLLGQIIEPQQGTHHYGNYGDSWGKRACGNQTYSNNQVIQPSASKKILTDKIATIQLQMWWLPRLHEQQREMSGTSTCELRTTNCELRSTKIHIAKCEQLEPLQ